MIRRMAQAIAEKNVKRDDMELYRKYVLVLLLFFVSLLYLVVMGIIAFIQNAVLLGSVDMVTAFLLVVLIFMMLHSRRFEMYFNVLTIIAGLLFLYLFLIGGVDGSAHLWCLVFPLLAALAVGHKRCVAYSTTLGVLLAASQMLGYHSIITGVNLLPMNYLIRYIALYTIIVFVSCIAEWLRYLTYKRMIKYHDDMQKSIKELEYARASLRELTNIDPLTEIYNKRFLGEAAKKMVEEDENDYIVSMFFDIDDFKRFNDYYGHLAGDKVLVEVVNVIKSQVNGYDGILARFGGEELVYMMSTQDPDDGERIARTVIDAFRKRRIAHGRTKTGYVTVSIGIAYCHRDEFDSWKDVVKKSDDAMYMAKKSGKNTYHIL